jgi:hypothetical protein
MRVCMIEEAKPIQRKYIKFNNLRSATQHAHVSPLESALTGTSSVTPLESALTKKGWGWGCFSPTLSMSRGTVSRLALSFPEAVECFTQRFGDSLAFANYLRRRSRKYPPIPVAIKISDAGSGTVLTVVKGGAPVVSSSSALPSRPK